MMAHFCTGDTEEHKAVVAICDLVDQSYNILYQANIFMTDDQVNELSEVVKKIGECWLILRKISRGKKSLAFKVAPKTHRFQHLPMWGSVMNPRYVQCYDEESLIDTTATIWKKSMNGPYKNTIQQLVLLKRTLGYLLRLEA